MFGFGKSYIQELLAAKDIEVFVAGIMKDPKRFFTEAGRDPQKTLRELAAVLDLAKSPVGQSAVLIGLTGALKVAAKDKRAPKNAPAAAQKLSDDLMRAFKGAGS